MPTRDLIGLQRAVVELVTDDGARSTWRDDPTGFAAQRLSGPAADALARVDPAGMQAMTLSHVAKKDRFDHLHRLHHEFEDRKAAERREKEQAGSESGHHHPHGDGHHVHADGESA